MRGCVSCTQFQQNSLSGHVFALNCQKRQLKTTFATHSTNKCNNPTQQSSFGWANLFPYTSLFIVALCSMNTLCACLWFWIQSKREKQNFPGHVRSAVYLESGEKVLKVRLCVSVASSSSFTWIKDWCSSEPCTGNKFVMLCFLVFREEKHCRNIWDFHS